ncbi:MAG: dodecin family protein [Erythrobacter sp.]|nr:dodecin family protein [Erythrobacter sp.]
MATCDRLRDVSVQAVDAVCDSQGVELERRYASDRKHLYRRYLAYCLEDKALSEEENAELEHLRELLHLSPAELATVHDEVAEDVYGKAIQEVLANLKISPEEDAFLRRLRGELHLSEAVATDLLERGRRKVLDVALREAATVDPEFAEHRVPAGDFVGRSDKSFEDAVADALTRATVAIPSLHWFEVANISGYVGDGKPKAWHVTVRGGIE